MRQGRSAALAGLVVIGGVSVLALVSRRPAGEFQTTRAVAHALSPGVKAPQPARLTAPREPARLQLIGTVQAGIETNVSAAAPGRVLRVAVRKGDKVSAGQLLIAMLDPAATARLSEASAGIDEARARLSSALAGRTSALLKADQQVADARAALGQARATALAGALQGGVATAGQQADVVGARAALVKAQTGIRQARQNLAQVEALSRVGGASASEVTGARADLAAATQDEQAASARLEALQAGPPGRQGTYAAALAAAQRRADQAAVARAAVGVAAALRARQAAKAAADAEVLSARAGVAQARGAEAEARAAAAADTLRSPISGVVAAVTVHASEMAQPGESLIKVVSLAGLHVDALAAARQIGRLRVGQRAEVTLASLPGAALQAVLARIDPVAQPDGRSFGVRFDFAGARVPARPGEAAYVAVLIGGAPGQ